MARSRLIEKPTSHLFRWRQVVLSEDGPENREIDERTVKASTQRLVASALASYMDASGECYPSLDALTAATALSRAAVVVGVRALVSQGWVHAASGGGARHVTRYQALIPPSVFEKAAT